MKLSAGCTAARLHRKALADRVDPPRQHERVRTRQFPHGLRLVEPVAERLDALTSLPLQFDPHGVGVVAGGKGALHKQAATRPFG